MKESTKDIAMALAISYNSLTKKMNSKIEKDWGEKEIDMDPDYIQREMDEIRNRIEELVKLEEGRPLTLEQFNNEDFEDDEE